MRAGLLLLTVVVAGGCSDTPRAPALSNDAVYENDQAGFRFVAPTGWMMGLRADIPPGPLTKPLRLVRYQSAGGEDAGTPGAKAGDMTVLCVDLPEGTDPGQYLIDHPIGSERWTLAPAQSVTVNGVQATRYDLSAKSPKKGELRREATTFRRGGRVFYFNATYSPSDTPSRDKVRQAVASIVWKDS